ncbi:MAG: YbaK/EbsC family protein [Clostridia bacterium]|nr:YbaK/EbsC family protein [Clostridia bacterium]
MSCEKVKAFLENAGYGDRFAVRASTADTVEHAAQAIGCLPAQIAKTMSFLLGDEVILVVASGDTKIANAKYKATFGAKATMIPFDRVEELTGHAPGGVCPFALREGVRVYLDESLKRFDVSHTSGGSHNTTVGMTPKELEAVTHPVAWVDVCALREA